MELCKQAPFCLIFLVVDVSASPLKVVVELIVSVPVIVAAPPSAITNLAVPASCISKRFPVPVEFTFKPIPFPACTIAAA